MPFDLNRYVKKPKRKRNCFHFLKYKYLKNKHKNKFKNNEFIKYNIKNEGKVIIQKEMKQPEIYQYETSNNYETKNENFVQNSNKNITIIIVALVIAFSYIYVENKKIAYKEKEKIQENILLENQKEGYEFCMLEALRQYDNNWTNYCKKRGLKKDCALPSHNADTIEKWHRDAENECMEKFENRMF